MKNEIKGLKTVSQKDFEDTHKAGCEHLYSDPLKAIELGKKACKIARASGSEEHLGQAYHLLGNAYKVAGEGQKAEAWTKKAIKSYKAQGNRRNMALAMGSLAEYHYERATNLKKSSTDINTQKAAAKEYAAAMSFISNYKNSKMHYEECRKLAIKRIAIIPFEDKTSTHKYGALGDMLVDGIISGIMNDRAATEFLEIITRDQMTALLSEQQLSASGLVDESSASRVGVLLGAHEILTGRLTQVSYIPTNETTKTLDETKNLKVGERSYTDDKGKKKTEAVYDDVTCYYKVHEKTTSVEIRGSYTIVDVSTGKIVSQSSISASYPWKETWGEVIGGDPRALSKDATALCNKPEPFPPHETQLVNNALNNLASQFVQTFKNYVQ